MAHFKYHFRTDQNKLDEMLFLRGAGWSYTALAERFECPKLTIRFLARKYGLTGDYITIQYSRQDYLRTTTTPPQESTIGGTQPEEKISEGKTYAEYLKDEAERKRKRLLEQYGQNTRAV